jgi:hypothetical protein
MVIMLESVDRQHSSIIRVVYHAGALHHDLTPALRDHCLAEIARAVPVTQMIVMFNSYDGDYEALQEHHYARPHHTEEHRATQSSDLEGSLVPCTGI